MDSDINETNQDIARLEAEISDAQNELNTLQKDIAEGAATSDKHKSQSLHYQKGAQAEVMRNNDLTKQLNQAENALRLKNNQVVDSKKKT
jgi:septal ring factor EnvC (AmiA/AmiB activator)